MAATVRQFSDGQRVVYSGDPYEGVEVGAIGVVVQAGYTASSVRWADGTFDEVAHHEIAPVSAARIAEDSDLLGGAIVGFNVRATFEGRGVKGVFNSLSKQGHLSGLEAVAEQLVAQFVAAVRNDPSYIEALNDLDDEDGDDLVSMTAVSLLRDALEL